MANGNDATERRARAALRRLTWQGGVATLSGMEDVDDAFWASSTPSGRFLAVWELAEENYGANAPTARGLRGSPHGIRRR